MSGKHYACSEDAYHAQKPEPFDQAVWDQRKVHVMLEAVLSKFRAVGASGDSLRELLLSTHPHPLLAIKGDTFWGFNPAKAGEDMLGVLLMRIREDMASAMWDWPGEAIVGRQRCERLKCFITEQHTGNCFVSATVTHVSAGATVVPTIESISDLRSAARLPETGYTTDQEMVQLLKHLSCVLVQPSHKTATILNAASNRTRCITVAMHGTSHVEPVILGGAVQVRCLSEVVTLLQGHGVHVPLAVQHGVHVHEPESMLHYPDIRRRDIRRIIPNYPAPTPAPAGEAAPVEEAAPLPLVTLTGGLCTLHLSKLDSLQIGAVEGLCPK